MEIYKITNFEINVELHKKISTEYVIVNINIHFFNLIDNIKKYNIKYIDDKIWLFNNKTYINNVLSIPCYYHSSYRLLDKVEDDDLYEAFENVDSIEINILTNNGVCINRYIKYIEICIIKPSIILNIDYTINCNTDCCTIKSNYFNSLNDIIIYFSNIINIPYNECYKSVIKFIKTCNSINFNLLDLYGTSYEICSIIKKNLIE